MKNRKSLERPNKFPRQARTTSRATRRRRYPAATNPSCHHPPTLGSASEPTAAIGTPGNIFFKPPCLSLPGAGTRCSLSRLARLRCISKALPLLRSIHPLLFFPSNLQTQGRHYYSELYRPQAHGPTTNPAISRYPTLVYSTSTLALFADLSAYQTGKHYLMPWFIEGATVPFLIPGSSCLVLPPPTFPASLISPLPERAQSSHTHFHRVLFTLCHLFFIITNVSTPSLTSIFPFFCYLQSEELTFAGQHPSDVINPVRQSPRLPRALRPNYRGSPAHPLPTEKVDLRLISATPTTRSGPSLPAITTPLLALGRALRRHSIQCRLQNSPACGLRNADRPLRSPLGMTWDSSD